MGEDLGQPVRILIVDDDRGTRESLEQILEDDYAVTSVSSGKAALRQVGHESFDVVLLDVTMPNMDGIETLRRLKAFDRTIDVVMISATDRAREATTSIRAGAYDYITKPFEVDSILGIVRRVLEKRRMQRELRFLRSEVALKFQSSRIVGRSPEMKAVFRMIAKVAGSASSVLITGESGTGKELAARAVHYQSLRKDKPFVAINCAAIPSELIESELFGHEKGAFTGASRQSVGKLEYASGGSVFLDEIATLRLELQAKLLRFLQEREITRLGGNRSIKIDVRMIAASNVNLREQIHQNRFREDLFFRLNVIPIELPPLRGRRGDLPLLANYFLDKFNRQLNEKVRGFTEQAMAMLEAYPWPGNIRELENLVERLVVLKGHQPWIDAGDLPIELMLAEEAARTLHSSEKGLMPARRGFERSYILRALRSCQWNQAQAARMLQIHRNTLLQKIKALNIHNDSGQ